MGNAAMAPCFQQNKISSISSSSSLSSSLTSSSSSSSPSVKLIFWEGTTRSLKGKHIAGDIMFEFPDMMVCHADSFFIGHPIPALAIDDELMQGEAYFVLPIDGFSSCKTLSTSSLLSLASYRNSKSIIKFGECPFEYLKGSNGKVLIKVMPEFITRLINGDKGPSSDTTSDSFVLCSTPELKKHYQQLVRSKDQVWSPKLETILEYNKVRSSPYRLIGLERKQKEKTGAMSAR